MWENLMKERTKGAILVEERTTRLEIAPKDPCALIVSRQSISLRIACEEEKSINPGRTKEVENCSRLCVPIDGKRC